MPLQIRVIDPHDEIALRAFWEVGNDATAERPGHPWPAWEVIRTSMRADNPEQDTVLLGAFDAEAMVGTAIVMLPLNENQHTCALDVRVVASRRRHGIGTRLLGHAEATAAARGRTTLHAAAFVPPGGKGPAEQFARVHGYDVVSREGIKDLALDDYRKRRDGLLAGVGGAADDYMIVTFDTVCPEEHLESFGRLLGMLIAEIPLGDLDLEDSEWTPERLRAAEDRCVEIGRHVLTALAIAPDGSVAGSSDVRVNDVDATTAHIGITLVDPAHRGHRLGMVLKVATHDLAQQLFAELETVETGNAEVNVHMNAINEALGYRIIETLLELQKKLFPQTS